MVNQWWINGESMVNQWWINGENGESMAKNGESMVKNGESPSGKRSQQTMENHHAING